MPRYRTGRTAPPSGVYVEKPVSVDVVEARESIALANNPKFLAIIERSRKSQKPRVSTEEMRRRLGLKRRG